MACWVFKFQCCYELLVGCVEDLAAWLHLNATGHQLCVCADFLVHISTIRWHHSNTGKYQTIMTRYQSVSVLRFALTGTFWRCHSCSWLPFDTSTENCCFTDSGKRWWLFRDDLQWVLTFLVRSFPQRRQPAPCSWSGGIYLPDHVMPHLHRSSLSLSCTHYYIYFLASLFK